MSLESAQGRNGVFVELVGVLVGEIGCCCIMVEEIVSIIMIWALLFLSRGGETGLYREAIILLAPLVAVEVITVRGIGRGSPPEMGWITGLNPAEGAEWNTVDPAREIMGVLGIGNATLKRGRDSPMVVGKLAGGERLSGDALGGVSGAYGMDTVGILDMLTTEMGA